MGNFTNGLMDDYGEFYWPDGKKYIGYYKNDKKDGLGLFYWPENNKTYIGGWTDGKQDGLGILVSNKVSKYGVWKDGVRLHWLKGVYEVEKNIGKKLDKYQDFLKKDIKLLIATFLE